MKTLLFLTALTAYAAGPINVVVPGPADPWLAGMPNGSSDCSPTLNCDFAPGQSPVQVPGLILVPGSPLMITAGGGVSQDPGFPLVGPNGTTTPFGPTSHDAGLANGIANILPAPFSSLVGVFLDANAPNLSAAPSPATDPSQPGLKQPFFIGASATVTVPAGATRLFLGTMDSNEWSNNPGAFSVQINYGPRYSTCLLYEPTKAAKSGSTIPIKLQLCDVSGANLSSAAITLHAVYIAKISPASSGAVEDSGNANPDSDFRFEPGAGAYIFNLSTTGLGTGTYSLNFTANGDVFTYSVPFQVK